MALRKTVQHTARLHLTRLRNHRIRILQQNKRSIKDLTSRQSSPAIELKVKTQPQLEQRSSLNQLMPLINSRDHSVQLTPAEFQLVNWLNECTDYLKTSPSKHLLLDSEFNSLEPSKEKGDVSNRFDDLNQSLELRIAGGWVRDKLLGAETNDLDIGISGLTGQEFARLFSNFIKLKSKEKKDQKKEDQGVEMLMGKISTIEARPDQSKHLETATAQFLGLELDFVQLRSEDYGVENHSRIPTAVNFGTPLQDALRRDITINSLFYNIHTGLIEDHTNKGLVDLESGLIRTPLPACQTFHDDPLRLLRCIRFATRFKFRLDKEIVIAARSEPIKNALMEKVSRERVGIEVDKMLKGPDPLSSIRMIIELGLYELVFTPPKGIETSLIHPSLAIQAAGWLDFFINRNQQGSPSEIAPIRKNLPPLHPKLVHYVSTPSSSPLIRRLFLACALLPYSSFTVKSGKREACAADAVLMDSLKFGNHDKNFISHLFHCLELINTRNFESILSSKDSNTRLDLGKILRSPDVHDLKMVDDSASLVWQVSFLFALVHQFACVESATVGSSSSKDDVDIQEKAAPILATYNRIIDIIFRSDLTFVVTPEFEKRRLDGKEICQVLGIKPGKHLAKIIEKLVDRQIQFPNLSKEESSVWLKNQVDQFGLTSVSS